MPPYLKRYLQNDASLKPCLRPTYLIGMPASASRRKPMICFSLNLLVLMSIILRVDGLFGEMTGTVYGEQVYCRQYIVRQHIHGLLRLIFNIKSSLNG